MLHYLAKFLDFLIDIVCSFRLIFRYATLLKFAAIFLPIFIVWHYVHWLSAIVCFGFNLLLSGVLIVFFYDLVRVHSSVVSADYLQLLRRQNAIKFIALLSSAIISTMLFLSIDPRKLISF